MNKTVTNYLKSIGARGGSKRKHHPAKRELAIKAARKRWSKPIAQPLSIDHATRLPSYPNESPSIKEPI